MGLLDGKIAVVTGGARGQGETEVRLFAKEGAKVVICDLLVDEGQAVAKDIGEAAHFHRMNVANQEDWSALADFLRERFGAVHILVNNAGITHRAGTLGTSYEDWQRVMSVNLDGSFLGIKALTPLMQAGGGGAIVNVASVAGMTGYHSVAYGVSKWGVIGLTKCAAIELVDFNIRVNTICPGIIETPLATDAAQNFDVVARITPQGRPGTTEEIAELALFLVSSRSSFITGQEFVIDGGLSVGGIFRPIALETGVFASPRA